MNYVMLVLRAFLMVICVETSIRYSLWWRKVRREDPSVMSLLLIGIAIAQGGIALRHADVFFYYQPVPMIGVIVIADALMVIGTLYHLFPAWRISHGYDSRRTAIALFVRGVLAAALSVSVFMLDFWIMRR